MYIPADPKAWRGRIDEEDGVAGYRWHQVVRCEPSTGDGLALLGLASDLGVQLNKGRAGAMEGPGALRRALDGAEERFDHRNPTS